MADAPARVWVYLEHNANVNGQLLLAERFHLLDKDVAVGLRQRGAARPPTKEERARIDADVKARDDAAKEALDASEPAAQEEKKEAAARK
jgi:hypothetical protein